MYAQLRIYTVNRGRMDDWQRFFDDKLRPIAARAGQRIIGPWTNEPRTEFIWIREYDNADDAKAKDELFYGAEDWKAIAGEARALLAKTEVTIMNSPR